MPSCASPATSSGLHSSGSPAQRRGRGGAQLTGRQPRAASGRASPTFYGDEQPQSSGAQPAARPQALPATTPAAAELSIPEYRSGASYGPIAKQETLWSIAYKLRPDTSISMDQMQIALFEANPGAFIGNISQLRRGATLQVPSVEEILAVDPATAKQRVAQARRSNSVPAAQPASRPAPAKPVAAKPEAVAKAPAPAAEPSKPAVQDEPDEADYEDEYADEALEAPAPEAKPEAQTQPASTPRNNASALSQLQALAGKSGSNTTPASSPAAAPAEQIDEESFDETAVDGDEAAAEAMAAEGEQDQVAEPEAETTEADTQPRTVPQVVYTPPVEEESGGWLGWLLGLLLLIAGGAGGWWFYNKRRGQPQAVSSRASAKPAPRPPEPDDEDEGDDAAPAVKTAAGAAVATKAMDLDQTAVTEARGNDTEALKSLEDEASELDSEDPATQQQATMEQTVADDVADEVSGDDVDFDVTAQFAAETMQINLDANDPISEADFHLAYGLYDEASMMLKAAQEKEPERTDIKIKLAETYFAGGNSAEFLETARGLKSELDDADWQKIAIMGSQIAPDDQLFQGADADLGAADMDLDFGGEDDAADAATELSLDDEAGAADADGQTPDPVLEFDLDTALADAQSDSKPADSSAEQQPKGNELEFDLGDFDLGDSEPEATEASAEAEADAEADAEKTKTAADDLSLDQDFGLGDLESGSAEEPSNEGGEFDLADLELDDEAGESDSISDGDEASTQLDLARAYVDMGDSEMARGLLDEVIKSGSDEQKQQAEELIKRLPS